MTTITLYTHLKNPDLHAISAQEAITQLLDISYLNGLRRYGCWELSFNEDKQSAADQLNTILDSTYYIVNPNKEAYIKDTLPKVTTYKQEIIKVSPKDKVDYTNLTEIINNKCNTTITQLTFYTIWEILIAPNSQIPANQILTDICLTTSVKEGLLANPISENCTLITQ